ncbi:unnamed protein product [Chrysoparadoxa australica]
MELTYQVRAPNRSRPQMKKREVMVDVPAGVSSGMVLQMPGEGMPAQRSGASNGDLFIETEVEPDPYFTAKGTEVHVDCSISITQAILGCKIDVLTLYGMVTVTVPPGTQHRSVMVLRDKGIKDPNTGRKGGQYIHFNVSVPTNLTSKQEELLREFEEEAERVENLGTFGRLKQKAQDAFQRLRQHEAKK